MDLPDKELSGKITARTGHEPQNSMPATHPKSLKGLLAFASTPERSVLRGLYVSVP
jgi:hypothetical protein